MEKLIHIPVLVEEIVDYLAAARGGRFIDGTVGCGGHATALLSASDKAEILGLDRDEAALSVAHRVVAQFGRRAELRHGSYTDMVAIAAECGWTQVDGILLDVGLSSLQLDRTERGFSFLRDGPLDMRMDLSEAFTAAELLNTSSEADLCFVFQTYGELPRARRLARAIIARREQRPWARTGELAELVQQVVGRIRGRRVSPAALCFQALRIAVNNELENLDIALEAAMDLLRPGGRLAVIAFHSLEDRLVKRTFREEAADCICPPGLPICCCNKQARVRILTRHPVRPKEAECVHNPRATSAKLRVCERL